MSNLLILGEQHKFSVLELKELEHKFIDINFIAYKDMDTDYIIGLISDLLANSDKTIILLNTKALIPSELLKYLTTNIKKNRIDYLTIQTFMEKYLLKSYVPYDLTDISFLEKVKPFSIIEKSMKVIFEYIIASILLFLTSPVMIYTIYRIKKTLPVPFYLNKNV